MVFGAVFFCFRGDMSCSPTFSQSGDDMLRFAFSVVSCVALLLGSLSVSQSAIAAEPKLDPVLKENCIKACGDCLRACRECLVSCDCPNCEKHCLTCLETCRACVALMEYEAPLSGAMCELCAKACENCAAECLKCGDMPCCKKCAEACQKCLATCKAMSK